MSFAMITKKKDAHVIFMLTVHTDTHTSTNRSIKNISSLVIVFSCSELIDMKILAAPDNIFCII